MLMPSETELLAAWERAYGRAPYEQALTLLSVTHAELGIDELAEWSLGRRDEELLRLRWSMFGSRVETVTDCPECGEGLELEFDIQDLLAAGDRVSSSTVTQDAYEVSCRMPTTRDLAVVATVDSSQRQQRLLARCIESVRCAGAQVPVTDLAVDVAAQVLERLTEQDPLVDIRFGLDCSACRHQWSAPFDVLSSVWAEINVWAQRLLAEVHLLATAYGWSEGEILKLGTWRRQVYLNMVRQ